MQTNIEPVRELYASLTRKDLAGLLAKIADDCEIELVGPSSIPFAGKYRGPEGMREFLTKLDSSADVLDFGPDEFHAADDGFVTVLGHERGRSKQTGREWSSPLTDTFRVNDDGKIHWFRCVYDTAAVAEAFSGAPAASMTPTTEPARA